MKRIAALILTTLALVSLAVAKDKELVTVQVTARNDSNLAYSYAFVNANYGVAQNLNLRGATLTLALPNGDSAVVNCTSKFHERFAGPGNVRSCRVPLVNKFEAIFDGDKAKLFWPTSLDGKKIESETYKIIAVSKGANQAPADIQPTPEPTPADQAQAAQQYADCLKVAVDNPSVVCKQ